MKSFDTCHPRAFFDLVLSSSRSMRGDSLPPRGLIRAARALLLALSIGLFARDAVAQTGERIYGLTSDNTLILFSSADPGTTQGTIALNGLFSGDSLLGLDFCPCLGGLFAVSRQGWIYKINRTTGALTPVPDAFGSQLGVPMTDPVLIDFNSATERIRLTYPGGNYFLNPQPFVPQDTFAGSALVPSYGSDPQPNLIGLAYSNTVQDAQSTELFAIDGVRQALVRQVDSGFDSSNGNLVPVGSLGIPLAASAGFDISSNGGLDHGFGVFKAVGSTGFSFYTVNLATGHATEVGHITGGDHLVDMAVDLAGLLSFSSPTISVPAGADTAMVTVTRTGTTTGQVSVDYSPSGGTAVPDVDYQAASAVGTLQFNEGEASKSFMVNLLNTPKLGGHTLALSLSNHTGDAALGVATTTLAVSIAPSATVTVPKKATIRALLKSKVIMSVSSNVAFTAHTELTVRKTTYVKVHHKRKRVINTIVVAAADLSSASGGSQNAPFKVTRAGKKFLRGKTRISVNVATSVKGAEGALFAEKSAVIRFTS